MNQPARAVELFAQQFSCAQAVLKAFAPRHGLEPELALKLARAFGLGMGNGHTCGALTGALMVLGLAGGEVKGNDRDTRYACYAQAREIMTAFAARHGSTRCEDLLQLNPGTPEGGAQALAQGLFSTRCPAFVATASQLLLEQLEKNKA